MLHSGAVELRNEIGRSVGLSLPGTLVFDYPTMAAIVAFLQTKIPAATASLDADDEILANIPPALYAELPPLLLATPPCTFRCIGTPCRPAGIAFISLLLMMVAFLLPSHNASGFTEELSERSHCYPNCLA